MNSKKNKDFWQDFEFQRTNDTIKSFNDKSMTQTMKEHYNSGMIYKDSESQQIWSQQYLLTQILTTPPIKCLHVEVIDMDPRNYKRDILPHYIECIVLCSVWYITKPNIQDVDVKAFVVLPNELCSKYQIPNIFTKKVIPKDNPEKYEKDSIEPIPKDVLKSEVLNSLSWMIPERCSELIICDDIGEFVADKFYNFMKKSNPDIILTQNFDSGIYKLKEYYDSLDVNIQILGRTFEPFRKSAAINKYNRQYTGDVSTNNSYIASQIIPGRLIVFITNLVRIKNLERKMTSIGLNEVIRLIHNKEVPSSKLKTSIEFPLINESRCKDSTDRMRSCCIPASTAEVMTLIDTMKYIPECLSSFSNTYGLPLYVELSKLFQLPLISEIERGTMLKTESYLFRMTRDKSEGCNYVVPSPVYEFIKKDMENGRYERYKRYYFGDEANNKKPQPLELNKGELMQIENNNDIGKTVGSKHQRKAGDYFNEVNSKISLFPPAGTGKEKQDIENIPIYPENKARAIISKPLSGCYGSVAAFDFRSLYPSLCIAYNICYCTILEDTLHLRGNPTKDKLKRLDARNLGKLNDFSNTSDGFLQNINEQSKSNDVDNKKNTYFNIRENIDKRDQGKYVTGMINNNETNSETETQGKAATTATEMDNGAVIYKYINSPVESSVDPIFDIDIPADPLDHYYIHSANNPSSVVSVMANGISYVKRNVKKGLIPKLLEEILLLRIKVKRLLDILNTEEKKKKVREELPLERLAQVPEKLRSNLTSFLNVIQISLKMFANTTVGYFNASHSGRFILLRMGESVIEEGRESVKLANNIVTRLNHSGELEEELFKIQGETTESIQKHNKNKHLVRMKVIYNATDSLFVRIVKNSNSKSVDNEFIYNISKLLCKKINESVKYPIKMKFEGLFSPFLITNTNRYYGIAYEHGRTFSIKDSDSKDIMEEYFGNVPAQVQSLVVKGLESMRKDTCLAVKMALERMMIIILRAFYPVEEKKTLYRKKIDEENIIRRELGNCVSKLIEDNVPQHFFFQKPKHFGDGFINASIDVSNRRGYYIIVNSKIEKDYQKPVIIPAYDFHLFCQRDATLHTIDKMSYIKKFLSSLKYILGACGIDISDYETSVKFKVLKKDRLYEDYNFLMIRYQNCEYERIFTIKSEELVYRRPIFDCYTKKDLFGTKKSGGQYNNDFIRHYAQTSHCIICNTKIPGYTEKDGNKSVIICEQCRDNYPAVISTLIFDVNKYSRKSHALREHCLKCRGAFSTSLFQSQRDRMNVSSLNEYLEDCYSFHCNVLWMRHTCEIQLRVAHCKCLAFLESLDESTCPIQDIEEVV